LTDSAVQRPRYGRNAPGTLRRPQRHRHRCRSKRSRPGWLRRGRAGQAAAPVQPEPQRYHAAACSGPAAVDPRPIRGRSAATMRPIRGRSAADPLPGAADPRPGAARRGPARPIRGQALPGAADPRPGSADPRPGAADPRPIRGRSAADPRPMRPRPAKTGQDRPIRGRSAADPRPRRGQDAAKTRPREGQISPGTGCLPERASPKSPGIRRRPDRYISTWPRCSRSSARFSLSSAEFWI
jgi:translation initiation factor IF-2